MRIGVDLVEVNRFLATVATRPQVRERIFTPAELALNVSMDDQGRAQFLAGRFAAKEAVLKALGTGLSGGGIALQEIEVTKGQLGEPVLGLSGRTLALAEQMGLSQFQVSLSHDAGIVIAFVCLS